MKTSETAAAYLCDILAQSEFEQLVQLDIGVEDNVLKTNKTATITKSSLSTSLCVSLCTIHRGNNRFTENQKVK